MYIDASHIGNKIYVSERAKDGKRRIKEHKVPYTLYYYDETGKYKSIYGDPLRKFRSHSKNDFNSKKEVLQQNGIPIFESDVPPVFRVLEEHYPGNNYPSLNLCLFDLEWDKDPKRGWSNAENPYAPITANTIFNKWEDTYYTLVVPPPGMSHEECDDLLSGRKHQDYAGNVHHGPVSNQDEFGSMAEKGGYYICENEADLLKTSITLMEDADVLSGWNSDFADIPYLIARIRIVLGNEELEDIIREDGEDYPFNPSEDSKKWLYKFNLFPCLPRLHMVFNFGKNERTYKLSGRVHLDYLQLYRKFTFEELHSYKLDFVLEKEVQQNKVEYDGSLDQLYRRDTRRFTAYSRQDVAGLAELDRKMKMVDLANNMAHMAGVTLDKVLGSVTIIEQAILKRLHQIGYICFDKKESHDVGGVPGAFVVPPVGGIFRYGMSYDFNSLYPTVIRMLNISPEMLVGQFDISKTEEKLNNYILMGMSNTDAWANFTGVMEYHSIIDETDDLLTFVVETTNERITATGKEWKETLKENNWSLSANGTVFDRSREGIVALCLTDWYKQRQEAQKLKKDYFKQADQTDDEGERKRLTDLGTYYDSEQQVRKIFLNSTYGAFLNKFFRFYDMRLGKSVTLSGRVMTKEMVRYMDHVLETY